MSIKNDILDNQIRYEIFHSILKNPGLHFNELSRKLKIPKSTLLYHINFLMKKNLINYRNDGKFKRFYIIGKVGTKDKKLLGFLRKEVPLKIIVNLLFPGRCSESELSKDLNLAYSTVGFHINNLLNSDVIRPLDRKNGKSIYNTKKKKIINLKKKGRKEIVYTFKDYETKKDIYRLIKTFNNSLSYPNLTDTYNNLVDEGDLVFEINKNGKYLKFNLAIDNFLNMIKEIFYFPFQF